MMIARQWKGRTPAAKADKYVGILKRTGVKALRATEGNRGVWVFRRIHDDIAEFTLISLWDSFDAIRRFAGEETGKAVYYPEDDACLLEKEPEVVHFEVVVDESGAGAARS
jgi:heme-degrading monooxygenase HmoA